MNKRFLAQTACWLAFAMAGCQSNGPSAIAVSDRDLTASARREASSGMAPDDRGDVARHHDYVLTNQGIESQFVWVPRFTAYQVLKPGPAGHPSLPVGAWVGQQPGGTEGSDWVQESFGGFYAGKYEASRTSDGQATVQAGAPPWADVTWAEADRRSAELSPGHSHLMKGDEWAALAIWASTHGVAMRGNTLYGKDAADPSTRFTLAQGRGAALTGSGRAETWGDRNMTSHTGDASGVFDLVGNVREWDGAVSLRDNDLLLGSTPTGIGGTLPGYVASMHTDARLRRYLIPGRTQALPSEFFGGDYFHSGGGLAGHGAPATGGTVSPETLLHANRGGSFNDGHQAEPIQAGVWLLCINLDDRAADDALGFRPALSF